MSLTITCVHQGYELYGSDRSFVECVETLRKFFPAADIVVVLPQTGPIVSALAPLASRIDFEPLWVLRRRDLPWLATLGLLRLPGAIARAAARFRRSDLVYINTSVIVDYTIAARFGRALLHVHELPEGLVRFVLRALLRVGGPDVIFNSQATRASYRPLPPHCRAHVLYNGIAGPPTPAPCSYTGDRPLRVLMLGRISRIKGQDVLVDALARLPLDVRSRVQVRIVGGTFGGDGPIRDLEELVHRHGLNGIVNILPFAPDPGEHFGWADIVAVPSRLPESLGRVAIEALAHGRPPLASRIGGLPEIVHDGAHGWLVPPGDAAALAERLTSIVREPAGWAGFPAAGRAYYEATFDAGKVAETFAGLVRSMLAKAATEGSRASGRPLAETSA